MINISWQVVALLAVVGVSVVILVFSLRNLHRLNSIRLSQVHTKWLFVLSIGLILFYLYYAYFIYTTKPELIHVLVALAFMLTSYFIWLITSITHDVSVDLSKAAVVEHYHATHDDLTGLPNITFFNEQLDLILDDAFENEYEVALLLIDLNRFQLINETIGYFGGDLILQEISQRIRESLRKTDLIARVGGDEFAVLINPVIARGHLHTIAKNIADSIQEPLAVEGKPADVGVSIGVAVFPKHADNGLELIEKARSAMIAAKKQGDAVLIYDPDAFMESTEDIQIIGMLQRAIQDEQLIILYQPQVRLHDLILVSVEALIRWQHPIYGTLEPRHFIPYAERAGLIYEINIWLLKNVVNLLSEWRKRDIYLPVAMNITANGFLNKEFQQELNINLKNKPWLIKLLKIELTETSSIDNASEIHVVMTSYKNQGLVFSLDDYGTKHASLEYLKKLPLDELKIDQSFMINATTDADSRAIILHAKEIAHQLGLATTAEGIESKEVLALAKEYKIDYGQGYYFSPAVPAEELENHIKQYGLDANAYTQANKNFQ